MRWLHEGDGNHFRYPVLLLALFALFILAERLIVTGALSLWAAVGLLSLALAALVHRSGKTRWAAWIVVAGFLVANLADPLLNPDPAGPLAYLSISAVAGALLLKPRFALLMVIVNVAVTVLADVITPAWLLEHVLDGIGLMMVLPALIVVMRSSHQHELARVQSRVDQFAYIFNVSPGGILITTVQDGQFMALNDRVTEIYGYSREELLGKTPTQMNIQVEDGVDRDALVQRVLEEGGVRDLYRQFRRKSGDIRIARASVQPIRFDGQNALLTIMEDVTESQDRLENIIRRESQYRMMVRNLPGIGVLIFDQNLRYIMAEGQVFQELGYDRAIIEGNTVWDVARPEDLDHLINQYRQALAGKDVAFEWYERDSTYDVQILPVRDADNEIIAGMALIQDITDRHRAERRRIRLETEREEIRLLREFITHMSHDFRTPLATMTNRLFLLQRDPDSPQREAWLAALNDQAQRLENLVTNLLNMSHLDSSDELSLSPVDLCTLLDRVKELQTSRSGNRRISLHTRLEATACHIMADEPLLLRALQHVVQNALDYSGDDEPVTITCYDDDGWVVVEVADQGIGIAESELPKIFDRFYRVDKSRNAQTGGSGLGLTIARMVVERHGGSLDVKSTPDAGSVFTLRLPKPPSGITETAANP